MFTDHALNNCNTYNIVFVANILTCLLHRKICRNFVDKINNIIIEKVNSIEYLGFITDKKSKFYDQIEFTCNTRNKMPIITSINIYIIIINPHSNLDQPYNIHAI